MPSSSIGNRRHLYQAILDPGRVGKIERLLSSVTHQGAVGRPVAVQVFKCGRRFGVEIKRMDALSLTGSMRIALANLQLAHLTVSTGKQSL
jgi:hypothetical protein